MSVEVTSGDVSGVDDIRESANRSIIRGVKKGMLSALDEFLDTIAFMSDSQRIQAGRTDKGIHMREAFEDVVNDILSTFSKTDNTNRTIITWDQIKTMTTSLVDYAEFHFKARGFYVEPSKPGTFPMRASRFLPLVRREIIKEIKKSLRNAGLEQTEVTIS